MQLRIVSALILAPIALSAVWLGKTYLLSLVLLIGTGMGWEWGKLCGHGRIRPSGLAVMGAILVSIAASGMGHPLIGTLLAFAGCVLAILAARREEKPDSEPFLTAFGILWVALPCGAFLWLAGNAAYGRPTVLWILAVVWATDIGAYAAGRHFGGPRLAPRLSPSKTWSGLLGGMGSAAVAGPLTVLFSGGSAHFSVILTSAALAIAAQTGDLAESGVKRHYGVKDSSGLIPGHGGLFDRLDGMLAVIPVVAILSHLFGSVTHW